MKIALVTSLNEKLYHYYGHMFYTSFNWPFDTYVYHEGWMPSNPPRKFIHRNIHETNPELQKFLDRNNPKNVWSTEQKDPSKIIPGTDFKRDACRFAYKIYAKTHLMLNCDYDYVFWVDADAVFLKPITEQYILDKVLPENNTICYLNRTNQYSECGFVGYNLKNNDTIEFIKQLRRYYDEDELFNLDEWHDSYVWDQVRLKYLKDKPQHKLCPDGHIGHVWSRFSVIKDYIGHMKGKTLKDEKRWNV